MRRRVGVPSLDGLVVRDTGVVRMNVDKLRDANIKGAKSLFLLGVMDLLSTLAFLSMGYAEGNPAMDWLLYNFSEWFVFLKLAVHLAMMMLMIYGFSLIKNYLLMRIGYGAVLVSVSVYFIVVINNIVSGVIFG